MGWTETADAETFWCATEGYLRAHRTVSTIVLTVIDGLRLRPSADARLAWWDDGGGVGAVVVETPPRRPVVSAMPAPAVASWTAGRAVPARLLGPDATVRALSSSWGAAVEIVVAERLHRLTTLVAPPVPASVRVAGDAERAWFWSAVRAFHAEATPEDPPPEREPVDAALDAGRVVVALDGDEPVAFASASATLLGTARIGPVFTHAPHRGRGHGAAVTAAAVRCAHERGADEVLLFTDLANPISNALYARLGFVPVTDVVDAALVTAVARKNV